ncbi:hypothetical protein BDW74DRAFT_144417 [Aspergillus multicolor]|uniref:uncharacterized protein n=1 Tax=Aspergillus multicolor TaxID=41759 RepID=UPI003CCCAED1
MSPDINSLPPSRSASASPRQRRNLTSLLDAIASTGASNSSSNSNINHSSSSTMSSELPRRHLPISVSERRRSGNLNINSSSNNSYSEPIGDIPSASPEPARTSLFNFPNSPIMGFGDPHHHRAPSLGELHQELEQEQEAQVNRLLSTIRNQELRIQHLEQQHQSAIDDATPSSERSVSFPPGASLSTLGTRTSTQLPSSLSSRRPSQGYAHSPNLRAADSTRDMAAPEWVVGPGLSPGESIGRRGSLSREDQGSSFYQAEAASLARENQMLRQRIRELERQLSEQSTNMTVPSVTPGDPSVRQPAAGAGSEGELSDKT